MAPKTKLVIIGGGIYGMSTAKWALEKGGYEVTILEKSKVLPAPDAASTGNEYNVYLFSTVNSQLRHSSQSKSKLKTDLDVESYRLQKIIRAGDYADPHLAKLSVDAVDLWRKPEWEGTYHETGVVCLASSSNAIGHKFVSESFQNCRNFGIDAKLTPDAETIKATVPTNIPTGSFGGRVGYSNPIGGWAEAGRALLVGLRLVEKLGGTVRAGAEVVGLVKEGKNVKGVKLKSGEFVEADTVVIAAGAWTPGLCALPGVDVSLPTEMTATGQSVATIQLNAEEHERYSKIPVIFNLDNGWYCFPPNPEGLIKMAIHGAGITNSIEVDSAKMGKISVPRTKLTPGAEDGAIPKATLEMMRDGLAQTYPELTKKEFTGTRLCWYCDTITGDWLIDYHPEYSNLVVASGDSGHGFKFAPIIGREILKVIERNTSPEYAVRWSWAGDLASGADTRMGERKELRVEDLVTPDDLRGEIAAKL